jgi:coatomer protein complex subunit alpha (xenin)
MLNISTNFHIKYLLPTGLNGIIKSTETTVYLMMVNSSTVYYNDAQQNFKIERFNYTECKFKLALQNKNYDEVVNILKSGSIYGIKAVEDIKNAGFPDLSLKFVTDPKQKFELALQSGKLEEAEIAAEILKDKSYYNRLAEKAMMVGKLSVKIINYF